MFSFQRKWKKITWNLYSNPCYAPVITRTEKPDVGISELRRFNVALPRHTQDMLCDNRLFFISFVKNITCENKLWNTSGLSFNFLRFAVQMMKYKNNSFVPFTMLFLICTIPARGINVRQRIWHIYKFIFLLHSVQTPICSSFANINAY